jgi:hypothetical protein
VQFVRPFLKPYSRSSLNFSSHVKQLPLDVFESSEQPELKQCQIHAVGRACHTLKSAAITTGVATLECVCVCGLILSCWRHVGCFHRWAHCSLFQHLLVLHVSLRVDCHTFDHVLLVYSAFVIPENCDHAFSSRRRSLGFFSFWEKWGDEVTGFSVTGCSAVPSSHPLGQCSTENEQPHFRSKRVIADMLPLLLFLFCT